MHKRELVYSVLNILLASFIVGGLVYFGLKFWDPAQYLDKTRDSQRLDDLNQLQTAVDLYIADGKNFSNLTTGKPYNSSPGGDELSGSGWIPLNFNLVSSGVSLFQLPVDPSGQDYYYRFGVNTLNNTYEIDCRFESSAFKEKAKIDGGNNADWYEVGTDLTILN